MACNTQTGVWIVYILAGWIFWFASIIGAEGSIDFKLYPVLGYQGLDQHSLGSWGYRLYSGNPVVYIENVIIDEDADVNFNKVEALKSKKRDSILNVSTTPIRLIRVLDITTDNLFNHLLNNASSPLVLLLPENVDVYKYKSVNSANIIDVDSRLRNADDKDVHNMDKSYNQAVHTLKSRLESIEQILLNQLTHAAVFFAVETPYLTKLVEYLKINQAFSKASLFNRLFGSYIQFNSHFAQPVKKGPMYSSKGKNVTGYLIGGGNNNQLTDCSLLIHAHYDAFAAAPELAVGIKENGTGVVALLALANILSKLYTYTADRGRCNIIFLLTDVGALNFEGAAQWIAGVDPGLLTSIKYVLNLDNLASRDLYLHTPKPYKNPEAVRFIQILETIAQKNGLFVTKIYKKINKNITQFISFFAHEIFTRFKLLGGTVSSIKEVKHIWNRSSIVDFGSDVDVDVLELNIKVLAESIARYIYNLPGDINIISDRLNANTGAFIQHWLNYMAQTPRFFALHQSNNFAQVLKSTMEGFGLSSEIQEFTLQTGNMKFNPENVMEGRIYENRPVYLDFLLLFISVAISLSVYLYISDWSVFTPRNILNYVLSPSKLN